MLTSFSVCKQSGHNAHSCNNAEKSEKPVKEKSEKPVKEKSEKPVKEKSEKPVKEKSEKPVKEKSEKPVKEKSEKPVKEKSEKPVKEKSEKPVKENSQKNTQSHIEMFKFLGNYNEETHETRFVNVSEFTNDFADLKFGNGGGWSRFDDSFGKKYRVCTIKCNCKIRYSVNCSEEDKIKVDKEFNEMNIAKIKGNYITFIKIIGIPKMDDNSSRSIRSDIRAHFAKKHCVTCGDSNIEIDHKNGEYNNPRVMTTSTQTIDDFQALCKHCNDMKRQTYVWQKKNNKRYPATNIPMFSHFGIKYVEGDETYDPKDPNGMVGTYWYDPVDFMKRICALSK